MSHMIADNKKELIAMVRSISMSPKHIQKEGSPSEHFDVCFAKRAQAIQKGAIPIGFRELAKIVQERKLKEKLKIAKI